MLRLRLFVFAFCCLITGLQAQSPCEIVDLTVTTGICTSDSTYKVTINFAVQNSTNSQFGVWGNGVFIGSYPLTALPLTINNFHYNGGVNDVVKVCINDNANCCKTKEFPVPACLTACEIYDLTIETGDCNPNAPSYHLTVDFNVQNPTNDMFDLSGNGVFIGSFPIASLPVTINNFPYTGPTAFIKVCIKENLDCCKIKQFVAPNCSGTCDIVDLSVVPGACTGDSTYKVTINFIAQNSTNAQFGVWGNGTFIGSYPLTALPLTINNFHYNGGANDVIKVCINDNPNCCETKEFPVPACILGGAPCEIVELSVTTGDCTSDSTYKVTINFDVQNTTNALFDLWGNGNYIGNYPLTALPLTITNFHYNGGLNDVIKICINDNPNCCKTKEFPVPACILDNAPCEIVELSVTTGDCTSDSTYKVTINFDVQNTTNALFEVWGNGNYIGYYPLTALPLTITNFHYNGGLNDVIKICVNDNPNCCKTKEFPVPACILDNAPCEIVELSVTTGDCTSDSTYKVTINFAVQNTTSGEFDLWANGINIGAYGLTALPLTINNFPYNGGANDVIKVCIYNNPNCCKTKEFPVPACILESDCHIFDLVVTHTPCICEQFFVLLSFEHTGGGSQGFDIVGNGTNYGNFPYNITQPIVLGPLSANNTAYEFVVKDHANPDCQDVYELGTVNCFTSTGGGNNGFAGKLTVAPNPTTDLLSVSAQVPGRSTIGNAQVEIYHTDGRLVRTQTVQEGSQFSLTVGDLPAGTYQLHLTTDYGTLQRSFVVGR